jgi:hypothetical protein
MDHASGILQFHSALRIPQSEIRNRPVPQKYPIEILAIFSTLYYSREGKNMK